MSDGPAPEPMGKRAARVGRAAAASRPRTGGGPGEHAPGRREGALLVAGCRRRGAARDREVEALFEALERGGARTGRVRAGAVAAEVEVEVEAEADAVETGGTRLGTEPGGEGAWRLADGRPSDEALAGAAALVYDAGSRPRDPRVAVDLDDARTVLEAALRAGVPRIVVLSSTEVHPPSHRHPGLLSEDRFQPNPVAHPWSRSWIALEELAARIGGDGEAREGGEVATVRDAEGADAAGGLDGNGPASGAAVVVLRAAPRAVRGGRGFFSRLLTPPFAFTVPGFDPSIQLLDPGDLARAIERALAAKTVGAGAYNIVPRRPAPVHRAIRLAGGHRLPVPLWLQRLVRRLLGPTGRAHAPGRPDFLRYPWTASGERAARELGFVARRSTAEVAAGLAAGPGIGLGIGLEIGAAAEPVARPGVRERPSDRDGGDPGDPWEWGRGGLDPFGMDRAYVARYGRTLFRFLHDAYWRIEARGLEHVPRSGRGVLTGVHRGFMPYDGAMALHLLVRETGRYPRFLLHPTLTKFPFLANFMTKLGGVMACRENADWVLERDGLVGIFPEGIDGAFTPYRRAYRLGRFGRDEYVRMALRNRAPIIPFVTVGSAEIYPILGRIDWPWFQRLTEWPYLPITPTFPLLPVPLPSKWHTRVLAPLHVEREHGPEDAEDPEVVRALSTEVRRRMEAALGEMLARRRSIFFGSVFDDEAEDGAGGVPSA